VFGDGENFGQVAMQKRLSACKINELHAKPFEVAKIGFNLTRFNIRTGLLPNVAKAALRVASVSEIIIAKNRHCVGSQFFKRSDSFRITQFFERL
jgi:hypothetical protein